MIRRVQHGRRVQHREGGWHAVLLLLRLLLARSQVLQRWVALLEEVAPEKPVSEIRNGWMEKRGAVRGG